MEKVFNDKSLQYEARNRELAALKEDAMDRVEKDESLRRISVEIGALKRGVDENRKRLKDLEKVVTEAMKVVDGFEADLPDLKEELVALEKMEADAVSFGRSCLWLEEEVELGRGIGLELIIFRNQFCSSKVCFLPSEMSFVSRSYNRGKKAFSR